MSGTLMSLCFSLIAIGATAQSNERLEEFNKIVVEGGGNLQVSYSDAYTISVDSRHPCAELLNISVLSQTLYIRIEDSGANPCDLTIQVGVPLLDEVVLNGGGNVVMNDGFNPKGSFLCKIKGGGNIDVSKLQVNSFIASIDGGGTILLTALKELKGNISGGGLIEYSGNPKVDRHVSGGGTVRRN